MRRNNKNKVLDSKNEEVEEFLEQSNFIEKEYSDIGLEDAKKAWDFAYKNRKNITVDYILNIHKLLAKRLRPDIAGKVRTCAVMIGYSIKEKKPKKVLLKEINGWIKESNELQKEKGRLTENDIKKLHIKWEELHVNEDFNGRVGRILWQIQRINNNYPIKIIYEAEKFKYYDWFNK